MQTIKASELKEMMDKHQDFQLVEVLGEESFKDFHLPEAKNIPLSDDFKKEFSQRIPNRNDKIVVYCKDADCEASEKAGKQLEELGYRHVFDYQAGKDDWKSKGYDLVS